MAFVSYCHTACGHGVFKLLSAFLLLSMSDFGVCYEHTKEIKVIFILCFKQDSVMKEDV
jgi:hypothetical protein